MRVKYRNWKCIIWTNGSEQKKVKTMIWLHYLLPSSQYNFGTHLGTSFQPYNFMHFISHMLPAFLLSVEIILFLANCIKCNCATIARVLKCETEISILDLTEPHLMATWREGYDILRYTSHYTNTKETS